jgi:hypothetical protein
MLSELRDREKNAGNGNTKETKAAHEPTRPVSHSTTYSQPLKTRE